MLCQLHACGDKLAPLYCMHGLQLTGAGYDMAVALGGWLRRRYIRDFSLLSSEYKARNQHTTK